MQLPPLFTQKKTIIIEIVILVVFLVGIYYVYKIFSNEDATTTTTVNQQLLGQNLILFVKATEKENLSLDNMSFMNSSLVKQLQDFSEIIPPTTVRGREDPFVPYAATRPTR